MTPHAAHYNRDSNIYRRIHSRVTATDVATLVLQENDAKPVTLKNLSSSGACIVTDSLPEATKKVKLVIPYSPLLAQPFHGDATVAWRIQKNARLLHLGLQFNHDPLELMPLSQPAVQEVRKQTLSIPRYVKYVLTTAFLFVIATLFTVIFLTVFSR